ncbi:MAG: hypothetical protein HOC23_06815, partial [Halieaceae bacterium]|nr:hypothetical protein [Halieaceae bacterium]
VRVLLALGTLGGGLTAIFYLLNLLVELPAWPATQWPLLCLLYAATGAIGLCFPAGPRFWSLLYANIVVWALLALATALFAPGAVVLFLPSLVGLALLAWITSAMADTHRLRDTAVVLALLTITPTTVALVPQLLDTQGYQLVAVLVPNLCLFGCMLLCLNATRERPYSQRLGQVAGLTTLALFLLVLNLNMYSPHRPQHVVLYYLEDRFTGVAHWLAHGPEAIPDQLRQAGKLVDRDPPVAHYYDENPGPVADAPITNQPAPKLIVLSDEWEQGVRSVQLRLRSLRGERQLIMHIAANSGLTATTVNDRPLSLEATGSKESALGEHFFIAAITASPEGAEIKLTFDSTATQTLYYADRSNTLPSTGTEIKAAREPLATPVHNGDRWEIGDRLTLPALK